MELRIVQSFFGAARRPGSCNQAAIPTRVPLGLHGSWLPTQE
jgi:hypothetical protein